ncbi:unnamed protein product [Sphagnum jensenii]
MIPQNNTCGRDEAKYPSLKRLGSAAWMRPSRACRSRTDGMYPLSYSHSPKEKNGLVHPQNRFEGFRPQSFRFGPWIQVRQEETSLIDRLVEGEYSVQSDVVGARSTRS